MGSNPINLFIRFILEIIALFFLGYWGWNLGPGWKSKLLGLGIPFLVAVVWGTFAVPDDPSRSGTAPVPIPGILIRFL
ncbi:MAG: YrdB family protein [Anaerolineales bacterium]|nr:YrdB family protein [Anaerolineales bacterium]